MKEVTRTIFESDDGKIFESRADCAAYEKGIAERAARTTYWSITFNPDLTEGRGYYGMMVLEVYGPKYDAAEWVSDWCFRTLGRPLAFVQGVSAMPAWRMRKISREDYLKDPKSQVGDYKYDGKRISLVCGSREEGLVEQQAPSEAKNG